MRPDGTTLAARSRTAAASDTGRGIVRLPRAAMAAMGLRSGHLISISGARMTHARVMASRTQDQIRPQETKDPAPPDRDATGRSKQEVLNTDAETPAPAEAESLPVVIDMDVSTATNAGIGPDSEVKLAPANLPDCKTARLACQSIPQGTARRLLVTRVRDMMTDRPLTQGDTLQIPITDGSSSSAGMAQLSVEDVDPGPAAVVGSLSQLSISGEDMPQDPGYPNVAGLSEQVARIREMVELPIQQPDIFRHLGLTPPRGVLFTGPPGTGKTTLARAVADGSQAAFFQIDGPEIVSKHYGDSERKLRDVFEAAAKRAPAIIFIDEIDAIVPKRTSLSGEKQLEKRLVAQMLTLLDGLEDRGQVVVIAATNAPDLVDPALRRPGRFDRELNFPPPDRSGRREILALHFDPVPRADTVDLDRLADNTHGYVGADLAALAREAGMAALARVLQQNDDIAAVPLSQIRVEAQDIDVAMQRTRPSALRETQVETPDLGWADIGGLQSAKTALSEAVIWPLHHADRFAALGISPSRGILLSGPPGGGKTLLARALAAESQVNFIPVRAASLLSQFLGEAERGIADLFAKARNAAPCILFMDELDALAPRRGTADPALERVVAQLLLELDGLQENRGVFVLGATNRPSAIDPALMRPGRFDEILEIPYPDLEERQEILSVHLHGMPLDADVSVQKIAEQTEGFSGADLAALVQSAARKALRKSVVPGQTEIRAGAQDPRIDQGDIQSGITLVRASRDTAAKDLLS